MATYPVTPRYRKGQSKVGPPRRWSIMHVIGPGLFCYECSKPTLPVLCGSKRRPCRQLPLQRPGFGSQLSLSGCLRWILAFTASRGKLVSAKRSRRVWGGLGWRCSSTAIRLSQVREQTSTGVSGRLCLRTEEQRMGSNVRRRLLKRRQLRLQSQIFYRHGTRHACGGVRGPSLVHLPAPCPCIPSRGIAWFTTLWPSAWLVMQDY